MKDTVKIAIDEQTIRLEYTEWDAVSDFSTLGHVYIAVDRIGEPVEVSIFNTLEEYRPWR